MIREIIRPTSSNYNISIPKEYINKEIEILILPFSEIEVQRKLPTTFEPKNFYGLGCSNKSDIDAYLDSNNSQWENSY